VLLDVQKTYIRLGKWSILETNTKWFQALDTVGGEPTVAGQFWTLHTFNKWMEDKTISR
jgi:hypothetical protein